jgi:arylsulfatase A-like enzyme
MRWPGGGILARETRDELLGNVDLLPTLLDLLQVDIPRNLDGRSFAGTLRGNGGDAARECHFSMMQGHGKGCEIRSVRTATHKLVRNFEVHREPVPPVIVGDSDMYTGANRYVAVPPVELYDLSADPLETTNLADDPSCRHLREALDEKLWTWLEQVDDPILKGPIATPYYQGVMKQYASANHGARQ